MGMFREVEKILGLVVAYFGVLSRHLLGQSEKNQEKPKSG
jgi:hypothetical protein